MPQPKHLTPLGHRIDFEALITVDSANPNGDPMKKGLPRTDSSGRGVISAVCIRRKLRNALAELGQPILISPPERPGDDLARRLSALPGNCDIPAEACRRWFDVRAFGQVFSSRGMHAPGVKGAVSIQPAVSVCPVKVISTGITCCLPNNGKLTMGFKSSVEHGLYILRGSIIPGVAAKNGLTCADCELLREALLHFPDNDCSSSRPAGSIKVRRLYWWEHPGKLGVCPPAIVFSSVIAEPLRSRPASFADYEITNAEIPGVKLSIFEMIRLQPSGIPGADRSNFAKTRRRRDPAPQRVMRRIFRLQGRESQPEAPPGEHSQRGGNQYHHNGVEIFKRQRQHSREYPGGAQKRRRREHSGAYTRREEHRLPRSHERSGDKSDDRGLQTGHAALDYAAFPELFVELRDKNYNQERRQYNSEGRA